MASYNRHTDNALLAILQPDDLSVLAPFLRRTELPKARSLETPRRRIGSAFFIAAGVASVVSVDGRWRSKPGSSAARA